MKKIIIVASLFAFGGLVNAQTSKDQKVIELLETMGTTQNMKISYELFISNYRKQYPDIPAAYWDKATSLVDYKDLVKRIVPIYSKNFTEKEIDDLTTFYKSSTGKEMLTKMPVILQESMLVGQEWGTELAQKIESEIKPSEKKTDTSPPPPRR